MAYTVVVSTDCLRLRFAEVGLDGVGWWVDFYLSYVVGFVVVDLVGACLSLMLCRRLLLASLLVG